MIKLWEKRKLESGNIGLFRDNRKHKWFSMNLDTRKDKKFLNSMEVQEFIAHAIIDELIKENKIPV